MAETASADPTPPGPIVPGRTLFPDKENQTAEVEGTVTFVGRQGRAIYLEVNSDSGLVTVTVSRGADYRIDLLLKSRIRVRGLYAPTYGVAGEKIAAHLSASNADDITLLQLPEETWQRFPLRAIPPPEEINPNHILHLRGKIQAVEPGMSFLFADAANRIQIQSKPASPDMVGRDVDLLCQWQMQDTNRIFESIFSRPAEAAGATALPVLTTAEQIRWLKPEEAARKYPIKMRGVVTYFRSDHKGGDIEDGTGGIFIWHAESVPGIATVKAGEFCEVRGVTDIGSFSPQIVPSKITVLGPGQFPEPLRPDWNELIHGGLDAQWVEIEGVAVSVTNRFLEVKMRGGNVLCTVPGALDPFIGAAVQVRGVVLMQHSPGRTAVGTRISVPSQRFISVQSPAPSDPFAAPAMHVADLFTYNPDEYAFQRVKISGQILQQRNGVYYVMDGTNGMRVAPRTMINVGAGDLVDAVGFPEINSPFDKPMLTLREASIQKNGHAELPPPLNLSPVNLLDRAYDSTRVQLDSLLINVADYSREQVLELQSGTLLYRARLELNTNRPAQFPPGSKLQLTGVYTVGDDQSVPFELLLNSPADIRVLELPSWWTVRHTIFVVTGMAFLIFLGTIWIGMLRRQVERRTVQLSAANKSLTNEIAERKRAENELVHTRLQHLVEKERTRIARDLHDDLGSQVTRVVLLLDELALQNQLPKVDAPEHPAGISSAAREIIQSLDETVWAVNPHNDTLPHLFNYLTDFAVKFLKIANVRCRLDFPVGPPPQVISTEDRHSIFLAVKEALNNAVKHARATEVRLSAAVTPESLVLNIEDDGRGFESAATDSTADGLKNMRQRMEDIGGRFNITSASQTGTQVKLTFFWSTANNH